MALTAAFTRYLVSLLCLWPVSVHSGKPAAAFQALGRPLGGAWRRSAMAAPPPQRRVVFRMAESSEAATTADAGVEGGETAAAPAAPAADEAGEADGSWWDDTQVQEKLAAATEAAKEAEAEA
eukprot:CAMPEP_0182572670 /NCGR_PEP_ID=MMETSP1324-20130603/17824_1 /TAXON_ID=236786 /ORGANISM="Florenciella sp., Strain RCC1587" /LENGTH=122 /DNA_ID=CAMNT_0024787663 /DNA_START=102 /DNA_END=467 /DNA_ORIENTATION=-